MRQLTQAFRDRGFVVVPKVLDASTVESLLQAMERLSGRRRGDASASARPWTLPDGVTREPAFWNVIDHPPLLHAVRTVLDDDVRYAQHSDLHVGFSSFNWHRDSVSRTAGVGGDWDEDGAPYRVARVGFYLHGASTLGLVPGTHRATDLRTARARRAIEHGASWLGHARRLVTGRVPNVPGAEWVEAKPGDAVIFDPRVLHTGRPVDGEKYSLFVAFGVPNRHFARHVRYYRDERSDLGYQPMSAALVARLLAAGLHHDVPLGDTLDDATRPSGIETLVMRRSRGP